MKYAVIMDARDYKKVVAKLESTLKNPGEAEKNIREALNILKKRG